MGLGLGLGLGLGPNPNQREARGDTIAVDGILVRLGHLAAARSGLALG